MPRRYLTTIGHWLNQGFPLANFPEWSSLCMLFFALLLQTKRGVNVSLPSSYTNIKVGSFDSLVACDYGIQIPNFHVLQKVLYRYSFL
uniref:Uncharacterized protein n=1 Tax=Brassica oleracea var. oleracea TaxID=109376 RepID=A0A0D3DBK6_BRAOL